MDTNLEKLQHDLGDKARTDEPLWKYTTYHIGGPADLFYEAATTDDLVRVVKLARAHGVPYFLLGGGTNILISDKGIRGLTIRNTARTITLKGMKGKMANGENESTVYVEADSGVNFNKLVRTAIEGGLAGIEMHLGLPGTVGGAVFMNSKWTHPPGAVGDVLYQATILTPDCDVKVVDRSYFRFKYDTSILQTSGDIVLSVVFALRKSDPVALWEIADKSIQYRRATQPQGVSTAGCVFRNISMAEAMTIPTPNHTTSAGFLIDHAGLKTARAGDAGISPVHANFIVNTGHATAADVLELVRLVKEKVHSVYGVVLEEEIRTVGEF